MFLLPILHLVIGLACSCAKHTSYTAAVFEHTGTGVKGDATADIVKMNIDFYKRAAKVASSKGADIIVFPEYGILPYGSRSQMKPFLENIPDPQKVTTTPCSSPDLYISKPIIYALSCIAQNNSLYVVANMGDIQKCTEDPSCPDGTYHFNTNVVFSRNGTLLLKYHKEHPFLEQGIDTPKEKQVPIFKTDFGTFATLISFDIAFNRAIEIANLPGVEGIAFPTMWVNAQPQFISVEYFEGWAMANNVTLFAANRQMPMNASLGSGVFDGKNGALGYTLNPDNISKLVVAKVDRSGAFRIWPQASITAITANATWEWKEDGKNIPDECSSESGFPCPKEELLPNYTLLKLNKSYGDFEVCNKGLCCKLSYTSYGLRENYYLGAFRGTYSIQNEYHWCEEACLLVRCENPNGVACSKLSFKSSSSLHTVYLRGNFTGDFVSPSVLSNNARLVSTQYWQYWRKNSERSIRTHNYAGIGYISVGLKGLSYNTDSLFH